MFKTTIIRIKKPSMKMLETIMSMTTFMTM